METQTCSISSAEQVEGNQLALFSFFVLVVMKEETAKFLGAAGRSHAVLFRCCPVAKRGCFVAQRLRRLLRGGLGQNIPVRCLMC